MAALEEEAEAQRQLELSQDAGYQEMKAVLDEMDRVSMQRQREADQAAAAEARRRERHQRNHDAELKRWDDMAKQNESRSMLKRSSMEPSEAVECGRLGKTARQQEHTCASVTDMMACGQDDDSLLQVMLGLAGDANDSQDGA